LSPTAARATATAVAAAHPSVAELVVMYAADIRATAAAFTRSAADADDLAQEVSMRALGFAEHFAPGTNFGGWKRTMMRNLAINRGRSEARRAVTGTAASQAALESAPSPIGTSATTRSTVPTAHRSLGAAREELSAPLLAAIDDLPVRYREVLLLWSLGELEYKEIASTLGIPVGTVMSRLHRARTFLRKSLEGAVNERGYVEE
jgi:RNA polymerase sigma-70 factor (ECF subfamily)